MILRLFNRLKLCEEKIDSLCEYYKISLEEQPRFKVKKDDTTPIGFAPIKKNGGGIKK